MTLTRRSFTALALASFAMPAFAATEPRWYSDGGDLAAGGRDVVAYTAATPKPEFFHGL